MAGTKPKKSSTITFRPGPGDREILAEIIKKVDAVNNPSDACRHVIHIAAEYYGIKVFYDDKGNPLKQKEAGEPDGTAVP